MDDEGVGCQDMDYNYDWFEYIGQYNHPFSIWNRLQAENLIDQRVTVIEQSLYDRGRHRYVVN